jgi:proline-specific peptidase
MTHGTDVREGRVDVPGGQVWYKIVGSGDGVPLLTLHGGPGAGHDYLESLEPLSSDRPIVFFDQLGCGRSDQPDDLSLWQIDRFVEEVDALRMGLNLSRIHLLGQSWGGWLAIEYLMGGPVGLESVTLASTSSSIPQAASETKRLRDDLPEDVLDVLLHGESTSDFHSPEYEAAEMEFLKRHLCRLDTWPDSIMRSMGNMAGNPVPYETIQGPNEFTFNGNLKNWDRTDRLGEITIPTLITVGRYDELTPACAETMHRGIPNSELHVFEHSAHVSHIEESEKYIEILRAFLDKADRLASR